MSLAPVGVRNTPVHGQMPAVEAAIRLVQTVNDVYGLDVDTEPLQPSTTACTGSRRARCPDGKGLPDDAGAASQ